MGESKMQTWYNFKNNSLCIEPESGFELSFLTDLLGNGDLLSCTTIISKNDKSVVGIEIKSEKLLENDGEEHTEPLTINEIDKMYEELEDE